MTHIDRRKALAVVAAVPAAVALASMPVLAGTEGDAKLRKLWEAYKDQLKRRDEVFRVFSDAEDAVFDAVKDLPPDQKPNMLRSFKRRFHVAKNERALCREEDLLLELADAIGEAAADTPQGVAIKLAVWWHENHDHAHNAEHIATAYSNLANATGFDPLGEIRTARALA